jgi:hypothetical protein
MVDSLSSPEQEKVTGLLNKFGVDYLATGDFALRKYVDSKYFQNIQLWVKPSSDNYQKVGEAFASVRRKFDVDEKTFTTENPEHALVKIGRGRKAVELYTGIPGLTADDFNQAFADRRVLNAGLVPVPVLHERDLHRTLEKSNQISQKADLSLLERAMPKLNPVSHKKSEVPVIDWREAARTIDPHRLLQDLGFTHMPAKGFFVTSKSQTYERGEDRITVYPNKDNSHPAGKPIFIDQISGNKGDAIDLLNWQHNYDRKEVNRYLQEHFGGIAPTPLSRTGTGPVKPPQAEDHKPDSRALAELQLQELREKYGLKNSLDRPEYLQSRGLSLNTIFRPEFFRQVLNALGWSSKEQKTIQIDNTVFPLRNDHGITSMIIRNTNFKGFPSGERLDSVWLSNPPLSLNKEIKIAHGDKPVTLPKGTEGTLVPVHEKPGTFHFYYLDPHKGDRELNFNKLEVSGPNLEQLTKALHPLRVNRLVITESPIDAMSFHQLAPPKQGETRMYLSTGGQPSEKQAAYINQLVQRIQPAQIIMGNDNEKAGMRFNINLMGAVQPPAAGGHNLFSARLGEVKPQQDAAGRVTRPGEYQLRLYGAKEPAYMEKVAQSITDAINRFTPKGVEAPARITLLNGSPETGSEATIAFARNDRFLQAAQKQLEKIINDQAPGKQQEMVKVVKPLNKDFTEDLKQSQEQKIKIDYGLENVPKYLKNTTSNLYHQVAAYTNNAFDALFGGLPGSLPRMVSSQIRKESTLLKQDKAAIGKEILPTQGQRKLAPPQADLSKAPSLLGYSKEERLPAGAQQKSVRLQSEQTKEAQAGSAPGKVSLPFLVQPKPFQGQADEEKEVGVTRSARAAQVAPQAQTDAGALHQKSKGERMKLAENPLIKPVAQVDMGFVRNEVKRDLVVIGQDSKGGFHEGIKASGTQDQVLWKSEMSAAVKALLQQDQIVFTFEPKFEIGEKITYGKDLSGNYFHTKNEYAVELGLKQQWTRLDPKEGKLMEHGPHQQQAASTRITPAVEDRRILEIPAAQAQALRLALHHFGEKMKVPPGPGADNNAGLGDIQGKLDDALKKADPAGKVKVSIDFSTKQLKEIEGAVGSVVASANPKEVFLNKPDEWFKSLHAGHDLIKQALMPAQKTTLTLKDGIQPEHGQKVTRVRL